MVEALLDRKYAIMGPIVRCALCKTRTRGGISGYPACDPCFETAYQISFALGGLQDYYAPTSWPYVRKKETFTAMPKWSLLSEGVI